MARSISNGKTTQSKSKYIPSVAHVRYIPPMPIHYRRRGNKVDMGPILLPEIDSDHDLDK